jgi:uncharacterized protein (TIGR00251 family)
VNGESAQTGGRAACQWQDGDLVVRLYVQPGAKHDGCDGLHDGAIKLRVSAPATEGKANARLQAYLSKQFGVPKSAVHVLRGGASRRKSVRIQQPRRLPAWVAPNAA